MARLNTLNLNFGTSHARGRPPARHISPELQLRRSVLACLLWESQFYEDGVEIGGRIAELVAVNGRGRAGGCTGGRAREQISASQFGDNGRRSRLRPRRIATPRADKPAPSVVAAAPEKCDAPVRPRACEVQS